MVKINILGTDYMIIQNEELDNADGICDKSTHEIRICKTLYEDPKPGQVRDLMRYSRKVLRHEVIHAFLNESGLQECSNWNDEQMVDYFACQWPKIYKAFDELDILE